MCNTDVSGRSATRQRTLQHNGQNNRAHAPAAAIGDGTPLGGVFETLARHRKASLAGLAEGDVHTLAALGIRLGDTDARLDGDIELLAAEAVRGALGPETLGWLGKLELRSHIGSTNTTLLDRAAKGRIEGSVLAAEVQTAGRGRRGRSWLSPYGRNLAVSIGVGLARPVADLGPLGLVVGIALRRALLDHGLGVVELKWPNDVLLDGRKLAGILIELVRAVAPVEVVVGIGVNVGCADAVAERVDQAIADVVEQIEDPDRNRLLARIIDHVVSACRRFDTAGFDPFKEEWNRAHRYRGATVAVTGTGQAGPETFVGRVLDIGGDGVLRIATARGVREFTGGEVTMREAALPGAAGDPPGPAGEPGTSSIRGAGV